MSTFVATMQRGYTTRLCALPLLLSAVAPITSCATAGSAPGPQDGRDAFAKPTRVNAPPAQEETSIPPPLGGFLFDASLETKLLQSFKAGDKIAVPFAGVWLIVEFDGALAEDVISVKPRTLTWKVRDGSRMDVTMKMLRAFAPGKVSVKPLVTEGDSHGEQTMLGLHAITVQAKGGPSLDLIAEYKDERFVGYRYSLDAIQALKPGDRLPLFDLTGWRVVEVAKPLANEVVDIVDIEVSGRGIDGGRIDGTVEDLRLGSVDNGLAALTWNHGQARNR